MRCKKFFAAIAVCVLSLGACNTRPTTACGNQVTCTQMFAMITATVTDSRGSKIVLDQIKTVQKGVRKPLLFEQSGDAGSYVIVDDSYISRLKNKTAEFVFYGYKNGRLLFQERYKIGGDCCHVYLIDGKQTITIPTTMP